ncbi:MAG: PaaI family thioesterase [Syntrophomonadales bacterium]|jgi:uncharacterized protein (TIGR00369 family)
MERKPPENKGIDEKLFHTLCAQFDAIPIHKTLDMSIIYFGHGTAAMRMVVEPEYTTIMGRLHGGIIASLLDDVMGWSYNTLGKFGNVTIDMTLNYFSPVFQGTELRAEGNVVHAGRSIVVTEGTLYDNNGKLIAKSRATFFVTKNTDIIGAN